MSAIARYKGLWKQTAFDTNTDCTAQWNSIRDWLEEEVVHNSDHPNSRSVLQAYSAINKYAIAISWMTPETFYISNSQG